MLKVEKLEQTRSPNNIGQKQKPNGNPQRRTSICSEPNLEYKPKNIFYKYRMDQVQDHTSQSNLECIVLTKEIFPQNLPSVIHFFFLFSLPRYLCHLPAQNGALVRKLVWIDIRIHVQNAE